MSSYLTQWFGEAGARNIYHLAAATVWGIILALTLGVFEYNSQSGQFLLRDNWVLATVGLCAIMYAVLALLRKKLPAKQAANEEPTRLDQ